MRANEAVADGTGRDRKGPAAARRRGVFRGYQWALLAFLLAGVVQIFLAGLGVFSLQDQGLATEGDSAFAPHRTLGFSMAALRCSSWSLR